ncbi:hypothetical protein DFJ74DRAFT_111717 [Hyaloraphidium curvatum]|nr:hypothetical protein DFJ74DRAFT_111717 [Hyaloraphidium curvatum]
MRPLAGHGLGLLRGHDDLGRVRRLVRQRGQPARDRVRHPRARRSGEQHQPADPVRAVPLPARRQRCRRRRVGRIPGDRLFEGGGGADGAGRHGGADHRTALRGGGRGAGRVDVRFRADVAGVGGGELHCGTSDEHDGRGDELVDPDDQLGNCDIEHDERDAHLDLADGNLHFLDAEHDDDKEQDGDHELAVADGYGDDELLAHDVADTDDLEIPDNQPDPNLQDDDLQRRHPHQLRHPLRVRRLRRLFRLPEQQPGQPRLAALPLGPEHLRVRVPVQRQPGVLRDKLPALDGDLHPPRQHGVQPRRSVPGGRLDVEDVPGDRHTGVPADRRQRWVMSSVRKSEEFGRIRR